MPVTLGLHYSQKHVIICSKITNLLWFKQVLFWIGSILKRCVNTTKHCKFQPVVASLTPHTKHVYRQTLSLNGTWPNALCILQTATNLLTSKSKIYNNRLIELKTNRTDLMNSAATSIQNRDQNSIKVQVLTYKNSRTVQDRRNWWHTTHFDYEDFYCIGCWKASNQEPTLDMTLHNILIKQWKVYIIDKKINYFHY